MRLLLAALCMVLPTMAHAGESFGPACDFPSAVMRDMPAEATAVRLDGDDAERMMVSINATDPPTDFRASTILIRLFRDHALVVLFDPCYAFDKHRKSGVE